MVGYHSGGVGLAQLTFWRASSLMDTGTETYARLYFIFFIIIIIIIIIIKSVRKYQ